MNWRQHWIKNEQARKRWIADISHELRTPVAVLKGKIVAMLDGVRALSIERIQSANEEVKELEQLLDNLYELTRTDLGTMHYSKGRLNLFHYSIMKPSGIIRC
ncbi:histidine kinase dimerization/phospho-acceptor domain-containing protein [Paraglaciecola sp. MB-3u-78]|uniref:histidine kinase dimerization/phospho-acceptor domain-containing protein n=1 Tax=Paraglaciecola sp. MB-3u-78 TaxID=2058332 RepID=UPI0012FEF684|nr:histidine kinase dimerization/phospho-acceptor domain-containing protein [Paraglaciecola sp. MB-3u-78]